MSHHQVTSSDLTSEKVWMLLITTPTERPPWHFQWFIRVIVSVKFMSRNFYIGDLRSDQFCDLCIISQREKNDRRLIWNETIPNNLKHRDTGKLDTLNRKIATSDTDPHVSEVISGHERSPAVFRQYLWIDTCLSDENGLDVFRLRMRIGWFATWAFPVRSLTDLDLRSNFKMTFYGQTIIHSTRLVKRNTMLAKWISCLPWVKVIIEKHVGKKRLQKLMRSLIYGRPLTACLYMAQEPIKTGGGETPPVRRGCAGHLAGAS